MNVELASGTAGLCWPDGSSGQSPLAGCLQSSRLTNNTPSWELKGKLLEAPAFVSALVLLCAGHHDGGASPPSSVTLALSWNFLNPGGEALSTSEIPLKALSLAAAALWGASALALALGGLAATVRARAAAATAAAAAAAAAWAGGSAPAQEPSLPPVRRVHLALAASAGLSAGAAGIAARYWLSRSASGETDVGGAWGASLSDDCARAGILALLLLLSGGWQVTRLRMAPLEGRAVAAFSALFLSACVMNEGLGGVAPLAMLLLLYVLAVRYVLAAAASTLGLLHAVEYYSHALVGYGVATWAGAAGGRGQQAGGQHAEQAEEGAGGASSAGRVQAGAGGDGYAPLSEQRAGSEQQGDRAAPASPPSRRRSLFGSSGAALFAAPPSNLTERQIAGLTTLRWLAGGYLVMDGSLALLVSLSLDGGPYEWSGFAAAQALQLGLVCALLLALRPRSGAGGILFDPRGYAALTEGGAAGEDGALPLLLGTAASAFGGAAAAGGYGTANADAAALAEEEANADIAYCSADGTLFVVQSEEREGARGREGGL